MEVIGLVALAVRILVSLGHEHRSPMYSKSPAVFPESAHRPMFAWRRNTPRSRLARVSQGHFL